QFFEEHLVVAIPDARRLALEDFLQHHVDAIGTKPTTAVEPGNTISTRPVAELVTHKDASRVVVRGFRDANARGIASILRNPSCPNAPETQNRDKHDCASTPLSDADSLALLSQERSQDG